MKDEQDYILYGVFLAINRCSKIIRDSPDHGYNTSILKEFEKLKQTIEDEQPRIGKKFATESKVITKKP